MNTLSYFYKLYIYVNHYKLLYYTVKSEGKKVVEQVLPTAQRSRDATLLLFCYYVNLISPPRDIAIVGVTFPDKHNFS